MIASVLNSFRSTYNAVRSFEERFILSGSASGDVRLNYLGIVKNIRRRGESIAKLMLRLPKEDLEDAPGARDEVLFMVAALEIAELAVADYVGTPKPVFSLGFDFGEQVDDTFGMGLDDRAFDDEVIPLAL